MLCCRLLPWLRVVVPLPFDIGVGQLPVRVVHHPQGALVDADSEMVRRHRSVLEVFSDPGVGSEFSFSIPTAQNTGWCDAGGGE